MTLDGALRAELDTLVAGSHAQPHAVLGPHPGPGGVIVRVLRPWARSVTVACSSSGGAVVVS